MVPHSLIEMCATLLNSDLIIFSMVTWADTAKILCGADSFHHCFHDHLSAPHLLWDYNNDPLNKDSLGNQVAKGASQISGSVVLLSCQIQELHGEMMVIKHKQVDIVSNQSSMYQAISELECRMGQTQHALLIQGQECLLCSQISDDKSRISSLHVTAMFSEGKVKEDYGKAINDFELALDDKRECLLKFSDRLMAVVGYPLLPSPPLPLSMTALPPPHPPASSAPVAQASSCLLSANLATR